MHPPGPLARTRQSLTRLRHACITACSAAAWVDAPPSEIEICPVESDIAIAIQLPSACAIGIAANATPIAIATAASFFTGFPTLFILRCTVVAQVTLLHGTTITRLDQPWQQRITGRNRNRPYLSRITIWITWLCWLNSEIALIPARTLAPPAGFELAAMVYPQPVDDLQKAALSSGDSQQAHWTT